MSCLYASCAVLIHYEDLAPDWPACTQSLGIAPTMGVDLASDWSACIWGQPHQVKRDMELSDWTALLARLRGNNWRIGTTPDPFSLVKGLARQTMSVCLSVTGGQRK